MFKAIGHEKQVLIVLLWSVLIFIGYNVLTVQADEKEDALRDMKFTNDDNDANGQKDIAIEQACKDNGGQWKENLWCKFDKDKTGDEVEFEHQLEDRGLSYYYADMAEAEFSEEWDKYQQEKYEKEQDNQKKIEDSRNEGKRYVNPNGGAPLYEDELTEEEKDDYTEYKPEAEVKMEDWKNTVEPVKDLQIPSTTTKYYDDEDREKREEEIAEYNEETDESNDEESEEELEAEEAEEEDEEDEPEEDNSDSES